MSVLSPGPPVTSPEGATKRFPVTFAVARNETLPVSKYWVLTLVANVPLLYPPLLGATYGKCIRMNVANCSSSLGSGVARGPWWTAGNPGTGGIALGGVGAGVAPWKYCGPYTA